MMASTAGQKHKLTIKIHNKKKNIYCKNTDTICTMLFKYSIIV